MLTVGGRHDDRDVDNTYDLIKLLPVIQNESVDLGICSFIHYSLVLFGCISDRN